LLFVYPGKRISPNFLVPKAQYPYPKACNREYIALNLVKNDDYMFLATRKHFYDLTSRYGELIYTINLMKAKEKSPRESLLSTEYRTAISFINKQDLS
jgi:hypothetical protein